MQVSGPAHEQVLGILAMRGVVSSVELQAATGRSQPTVSRLLDDLSSRVLTLGSGRATRYALPKSIHGRPSRQPLWLTTETGEAQRFGTLSFLSGDNVHVDSPLVSSLSRGELPWFLSPLQVQGFLGRLHARRLAELAPIDLNPERWNVEAMLFAALDLHDGSGALTLGSPAGLPGSVGELPAQADLLAARLDEHAVDVARTLPIGSSAGGEQPKFLAHRSDGQHVLVKFTPPRGTPFGDRWADLLGAEALANRVLAEHGVAVAATSVVESRMRRYLVSERFDRIGLRGRRHVVSVGAVHAAFVADSYVNWGRTCEALARQRRLSTLDAERASALLQFGRLIGNSDMHSGNLSFFVQPQDLSKGRFALAPVYDMLPMRWRPDAALGGAPDYAPFEPDPASLASSAVLPARVFWSRLTEDPGASKGLRSLAREMTARLR